MYCPGDKSKIVCKKETLLVVVIVVWKLRPVCAINEETGKVYIWSYKQRKWKEYADIDTAIRFFHYALNNGDEKIYLLQETQTLIARCQKQLEAKRLRKDKILIYLLGIAAYLEGGNTHLQEVVWQTAILCYQTIFRIAGFSKKRVSDCLSKMNDPIEALIQGNNRMIFAYQHWLAATEKWQQEKCAI